MKMQHSTMDTLHDLKLNEFKSLSMSNAD